MLSPPTYRGDNKMRLVSEIQTTNLLALTSELFSKSKIINRLYINYSIYYHLTSDTIYEYFPCCASLELEFHVHP